MNSNTSQEPTAMKNQTNQNNNESNSSSTLQQQRQPLLPVSEEHQLIDLCQQQQQQPQPLTFHYNPHMQQQQQQQSFYPLPLTVFAPAGNMQQQQHQFPHVQQQQQQQHPFLYHHYPASSFCTLPKPPLKGILKNSQAASNSFSATQLDVLPFDTVPPCDDCMERARVRGSYTADCVKPDCAMAALRRKKDGAEDCGRAVRGRRNSTRSLKAFRPSSAAAAVRPEASGVGTTAFRGSQESLLSNLGEKEVLENVESSV